MKTITIKTINGTFENVNLDFTDLMSIQTKGSKRTMVLGSVSTVSSISSLFVSNPVVKTVLWSAGLVGAIATIVSNNKAIDEAFSDKGMHEANCALAKVCVKKGIIMDPAYYGLTLEEAHGFSNNEVTIDTPVAAEC